METSRQCYTCKHYDDNHDPSVGMYGQPVCGAVPGDEEASEQVAVVLENILFALAHINNCPMWKEKGRRSILNVIRGE